jgi:hypothetical protein
MFMANLAGRPDADTHIRRELRRARVPAVVTKPSGREVAYSVIGVLDSFVFTRAWTYWVVEGPVPLSVAEELYTDPVGRTDIRAAGDAGCRPPDTVAKQGVVNLYHIDTELGLRVFVDAIRVHLKMNEG